MARMIKKKKVDWFCDIAGKSLPPPFLIMEGGGQQAINGSLGYLVGILSKYMLFFL